MNTKLGLEQKSIVTEQRAESPTPKGWMWCCDGRGRYLECSPEVSECLGISAKDFMGMPVAWFGLTLSSAERLQEALLKASFPTRLELIYQTHEGIEIPVSFYIMGKASLHGKDVLRGFVQIIDQPEYPRLNNAIVGPRAPLAVVRKEIAPQTERYQQASQLVMSLLDELHQSIVDMYSPPASRVVKESDLRVVEDQSRTPRVKGVLYDKKLVSYPERIVLQVVYRLEWGYKLDLSQTEEDYLEKNRISAAGLTGKVRRRFAPPKMLVYDKYWIAVELAVIKNSIDSLSVIYDAQSSDETSGERGQPSKGISTTLMDFIENPEPVRIELQTALKHPVHSRRVLHRGRDYLVRD